VILFSAILTIASSAFAQPDAEFLKANQAFAEGHFQEAISGYEMLVQKREWSANLFYNLGNTYFRTRDFGRAILNYQRALALDRHHPEATANLQIARDEARSLEMQPSRLERYLHFASANEFSIVAAVAFWIAVFSLAALLFRRGRSAAIVTLLFAMLLVFTGATFATWQLERGSNGRVLAVVTDKNVQARLATADTANAILALPPGSEVNILSTRGDWNYAALPNNLRGWIPTRSVESVRL
jgi:tetratricopeptide (TPR) repeat protein